MVALTGGILCNGCLPPPQYSHFIFLALAFLAWKKYPWVTDISVLIFLFCAGLQITSPTSDPVLPTSLYPIHARCEEQLPHNNYILSGQGQRFYLSHFYTDTNYRQGDSLSFLARIKSLADISNPGEFSYTRYLKQKNVRYQLIPHSAIRQTGHSHTIRSLFSDFRRYFLQKTVTLIRDSSNRQLINALCLGYKNDLDSKLQNLFITTGTVHLLSVSGLHTGAIYLLMVYILRLTGLSGKKKELIILPALWGYACLTGLSPSVVRAATILSFISAGRAFNRTYTPLNSLAASAFITLLISPYTLYSLSFLMSYSAYGGILLLYPILYRLPGKLPSFPARIYACCCLTISAQFFTLPVSAYYFHTINLTGLFTNIPAIPLATSLLYCSAISLILPLTVSQYLIPVNEFIARLLIRFLKIATPYSLNIQNLYPSTASVILIYCCLLASVFFIRKRQHFWLSLTTIFVAALFLCQLLTNWYLSSRQELIVFHYHQKSAVLLNHQGFYLILKNNSSSPLYAQEYIRSHKLRPYPPAQGAISSDLYWFAPYLAINGTSYFIADSSHISYQPCHTLIVTDKLFPGQIFNSLPSSPAFPESIITDGSITSYTLSQWKTFCRQHNILLQSTTEEGAICLSLK